METRTVTLTPMIDVYNVLWKMVESYYGSNHYCIRPNYEMVLGEMTALATWTSPSPFGDPLIRTVREQCACNVALAPIVGLFQFVYRARNTVVRQQIFLLEKLVDHMRERSKDFNPELL